MISTILNRSFVAAATGAIAFQSMSTVRAEETAALSNKYANDALDEEKAHIDTLHDHIQLLDNIVRGTIDEIISKDENVLPNSMYLGVAALAGTIIARDLNIILQFLTSTSTATAFYFLPKTTHNLGMYLEKLKRKYPHASVNEAVDDLRKEIDATLLGLRGQLN